MASQIERGINIVLAYHLNLGAYGFWLPNDPRGSGSNHVWSKELYKHGSATKVPHGTYVAKVPHDRARRIAAKQSLIYPPVRFNLEQIRCVGDGFAQASENYDCDVLACASMHDHAHLVILRHELGAEKLAEYFKSAASRVLRERGLHPFQHLEKPDGRLPKVWQGGCWPVFLDSREAIVRCIEYVVQNPEKEGLPKQVWSFVKPFDEYR